MSTDAGGEVRSRSKKGRAYPNPTPKHHISGRLELVRARCGYLSKRAFHQELTEGDEYVVSYEALRNYHYNREPPPSYLARVAKVFSVRLEWLVTGEGSMTEVEPLSSIRDRVLERVPGLRLLPYGHQARFMDLVADYSFQARGRAVDDDELEEEMADLAYDLMILMTLPFRCWGFAHPEDLSGRDLSNYFGQMMGALTSAMKPHAKGDHMADRPTDFMRRIYDADEAEPLTVTPLWTHVGTGHAALKASAGPVLTEEQRRPFCASAKHIREGKAKRDQA